MKIVDSALVISTRSAEKLEPKACEKFRKRMPFVDAFLKHLPTFSECKALLLPLRPIFYLTATVLIPYSSLIQYSAPVSPGLFISISTFWSHLCPLFAHRTACPCVVLPLPTAASVALPAPPIIPTSASTTPAKNPGPAPPINSPANWASARLFRPTACLHRPTQWRFHQ